MQNIDRGHKCLGDLPDGVLRLILSFLPITDAVKTSILSKRWEYLWVSIPILDFARETANKSVLMNFVERAISLRDSSLIKRFSLCCDVLEDDSRVYRWISTLVGRHNIQELYLKLEGFVTLPYCLFTCRTLTSLHIDILCVELPTIICFSSLKILSIKRVTFLNEDLTQKLFSSLPVLEELKLENCSWGDLKNVNIFAPKLHSLCIFEMPEEDFGDFEMLEEDFEDSSDFCQVEIVGDSLKEFYYIGNLVDKCFLIESFSLEKAEVVTKFENVDDQCALRLLFRLIGLSNAEQLTLCGCAIEALINVEERLSLMPMFNNLTDLIIVEDICLNFTSLVKILRKAPCLTTLNFSEGVTASNLVVESSDEEVKSIDEIWDLVPLCFLSHLKLIKVGGYDEKDEEMLYAVKFLLKNTVVLDEIIITFSKVNLEMQLKVAIANQLSELPRASKNCKIILE